MDQEGSSYPEGRSTIHEPGRRELPTQSYVRPLSWLDTKFVAPRTGRRRPSTSFFWWRPLIEVETSKVKNFLVASMKIFITMFNSTKCNFSQYTNPPCEVISATLSARLLHVTADFDPWPSNLTYRRCHSKLTSVPYIHCVAKNFKSSCPISVIFVQLFLSEYAIDILTFQRMCT